MGNTKKSLSTFVLMLCISFLSINCKDQKSQNPDDKPKQETVERPTQIIEVDVAREQYLTYEKRRVGLIQKYEDSIDGYDEKGQRPLEQNGQQAQQDPNDPNGARFDVARYVYWDYKTIKDYLKYIEQEAEAANIEISTLRFYFSNYPPNDKSAVHPRQNSIIITPTLHENNREYIFAIDDRDIKNLKPQLLSDSFVPIDAPQEKGMGQLNGEEERSYASFLPFGSTTTNNLATPYMAGRSVSMNRGTGAPPPHNEQ